MNEEIKVEVAAMAEEIEAEVKVLNRTKKVKKILKWTAIGTIGVVAVIYAGKVLSDNIDIEVIADVIEEVGE